jgi:predicted transcriptional regulator
MSVWRQTTSAPTLVMLNLNKSEADALQQLLNGERLWSWPNGRVQLGQSFPDLSVINNLVRQGLLDQSYEPTEAGRAALQS